MYEYFYKEPEDYYEETVLSSNTTKAVPVNKYSYWQHDDASWIFSAGGNILLKDRYRKR